jgi:adenosylhomocysteinase
VSDSRNDLADRGEERIGWIRSRMALLQEVRERFAAEQPFAGRTIGVALHTEPKTAVLLETLAAGGARIVGTGNHGSTQDDVVAALGRRGIMIFGRRDDTLDDHVRDLGRTLDAHPDVLLDNGADLALMAQERGQAGDLIAGTEETTSGGFRLREHDSGVPFPVIVINDSPLKAIAENRHAVGQSTVESFLRITNLSVIGKRVVVVGYGWVGRGVAQYLRSFGAKVAVVEPDELKAFDAAFEGFRVAALADLAGWAQVVLTATGRPGVVPVEAVERMEAGTVLGNVGHFPWEIDVAGLRDRATSVTAVTPGLERVDLPGGTHVVLVTGGRMFNLGGVNPKGNSIESMDIGFLLQALSLERVVTRPEFLVPGPQRVPDDIERHIARRVLAVMGADR